MNCVVLHDSKPLLMQLTSDLHGMHSGLQGHSVAQSQLFRPISQPVHAYDFNNEAPIVPVSLQTCPNASALSSAPVPLSRSLLLVYRHKEDHSQPGTVTRVYPRPQRMLQVQGLCSGVKPLALGFVHSSIPRAPKSG